MARFAFRSLFTETDATGLSRFLVAQEVASNRLPDPDTAGEPFLSFRLVAEDGRTYRLEMVLHPHPPQLAYITDGLPPPHVGFRIASVEAAQPEASPTAPSAAWLGPQTQIETRLGTRPAASLEVGEMVLTRDVGFQPIIAIHDADEAEAGFVEVGPHPLLRGALSRRLLLSAGHHVLLGGPEIRARFDQSEVFAPAQLVSRAVAQVSDAVQLVFENPQVICANGLWVEGPGQYHAATRLARPTLPASELKPLLRETAGTGSLRARVAAKTGRAKSEPSHDRATG